MDDYPKSTWSDEQLLAYAQRYKDHMGYSETVIHVALTGDIKTIVVDLDKQKVTR